MSDGANRADPDAGEGHYPKYGAVFGDRDAAEAAVDDLIRSGLADQHLGVAMKEPTERVFEEDLEAGMSRSLRRGIAIGGPIGAIAGMTLLAVLVPGVGTLGAAGILAAGGATGALAGGFWGAYLGVKSEEEVMEAEWEWERSPLREGETLVVVDQHGHPEEVTRILTAHGGRIVQSPES